MPDIRTIPYNRWQMIATILLGSMDFHVVKYKDCNVAKGLVWLIEMKNFRPSGVIGDYVPEELVTFLKVYSSRNDHIRKA